MYGSYEPYVQMKEIPRRGLAVGRGCLPGRSERLTKVETGATVSPSEGSGPVGLAWPAHQDGVPEPAQVAVDLVMALPHNLAPARRQG